MLRFFPNNSSQVSQIKKYYAYNGVLTVLNYDPNDFHAHLLIGLTQDGKVRNLSFSSCKQEGSSLDDSMFSMNVNEESQIHLTFNSTNLYYVATIQITEKILGNIHESICDLYCRQQDSDSVAKPMPNPEALLREISTCANIHANIVKAHSGTRDAIHQNIPMFIELLTSKFNEELKRFEVTTKKIPTI